MVKFIASHPYVHVSRTIENNQQHYIENEECLFLYEDRLETASQRFMIGEVFDVSYRRLSHCDGFLYLHTNKGVFPFRVKEKPDTFIEAYKKMKT